jgi:hypothetical protein
MSGQTDRVSAVQDARTDDRHVRERIVSSGEKGGLRQAAAEKAGIRLTFAIIPSHTELAPDSADTNATAPR